MTYNIYYIIYKYQEQQRAQIGTLWDPGFDLSPVRCLAIYYDPLTSVFEIVGEPV